MNTPTAVAGWRHDDTNALVYPSVTIIDQGRARRTVKVFFEGALELVEVHESETISPKRMDFPEVRAAAAYFAAMAAGKPWLYANQGEGWLLDVKGEPAQQLYVFRGRDHSRIDGYIGGEFAGPRVSIGAEADSITAGVRIFG